MQRLFVRLSMTVSVAIVAMSMVGLLLRLFIGLLRVLEARFRVVSVRVPVVIMSIVRVSGNEKRTTHDTEQQRQRELNHLYVTILLSFLLSIF